MEKEKEKLIREIHQIGQAISQSMGQYACGAWIDLDLTIGQLKSLVFIDFEGSTCVKDLASALKMAPSNATNLVDSLVKAGLVSREENPDDRRMLLLETTPKGENLITNLRESALRQMSDLLTQFSLEELRALANGLNPLVKLMQERRKQLKRINNQDDITFTGLREKTR
jgi:MarR family transcriptional regulator, organic hydroperoxide resistance regulator